MRSILRFQFIVLLIFFLCAAGLSAQEAEPAGGLLAPVYPDRVPALIYVEGEDAVSTNFSNQPVSNYGCSGYRSVQLSRTTGLQGGASFYAEFVFYVEEAGDYELWYGGTPPGPADELSPSYSSPFSYIIDDGERKRIYREDVSVVEGYTPSYYWNRVKIESLSAGSHRIRFEVSEKRRYDGRYYFYLDSLFFLNRDKLSTIGERRPAVFPSDLNNESIDNPFLTIREYENIIDRNPDDKSAYIELSLVYSLLGDYQNSLKYLNRASALDMDDPYPVILSAKNRLWKGDVRESLSLYERALSISPDDPVLWSEAGKVSAWTASYPQAISFFSRGIERFPGDLNLRVNLGLTYLWMSKAEEAAAVLDEAEAAAVDDPAMLRDLGRIQEANGYSEWARGIYDLSIEKYPEYLEFYLLLQKSYLSSGMTEDADSVAVKIEQTFEPSEKLRSELDTYKEKLSLRDEVIESYLIRLREDPGNLALRQELAQTYFWNGLKAEAIEQIRYVLTTHTNIAAGNFVRRNEDLIGSLLMFCDYYDFFGGFSVRSSGLRGRLQTSLDAFLRADAAVKSAEAAEDSDARIKAADELREKRQDFADAAAEAQQLLELWELMNGRLSAAEDSLKTVLSAEKDEAEAFAAAVSSSGWSWDRGFLAKELGGIMETEPELASFMLGLIEFSEKDYLSTAEILSVPARGAEQEVDEGGWIYDYSKLDADRLTMVYLAAKLNGGDADEALTAEAEERLAFLPGTETASEAAAGVYYQGLEAEAVELRGRLSALEGDAAAAAQKAGRFVLQSSAVFGERLARANYYLESDTYLIRYELGDYYLEEGLNQAASRQYRRVIAVDPWNISAIYKLGVVEQRYGNWSEAMKYYRKVYYQDPAYENTVYYYNQLARENADRLNALFQLTSTPQKMAYTAGLDFLTRFNSFLGLRVGYTLDQQRRYRAYTGELQGSYQMHRLDAGLPLSFSAIGLEITPFGGVYADSLYYKNDYSFSAGSMVSLPEFVNTLSVFPLWGVKAAWSWDFLSVEALWDYGFEAETLFPAAGKPEGLLIRSNDISLNVNTWINFDDVDFLGPLTTRTYAELELLSDSNMKWQLFQDAYIGFRLTEMPILKLSPGLSLNYESSADPSVSGYYTPDNVLEAKAALRSTATIPSDDWSTVFEVSLWGAGGGYWSGLASASAASYLKAEGGLILTVVKNGSSYYLNCSGLGTFNETGNKYWEISISAGTGTVLPGLLTP